MQQDNNQNSPLPRHVAVVMDGNGRWAAQRQMPRVAGHRAGVETVKKLIEICSRKQIEVLTLFAFSSENWRRPEKEVTYLMELFLSALQREINKLHKNNVQLRFIGNCEKFNESLLESIQAAQKLTAQNTGLKLVVAVDYGGQWDIIQACKKIGETIESGQLSAKDITKELLESHLSCADLPHPDLFIRTSGELRISNFLIWQLAYTELYFTEILWPDFDEHAFENALSFFATRQRRFGSTTEQLEFNHHV